MLRKGLQVHRSLKEGTAQERYRGITRKFKSRSRHQGLLMREGT